MDNVLIVNADDFGLSKGQNYGIVEACRYGVVTSTTAMVNAEAIGHAVALSRDLPGFGIGMHFVLTLGMPLTAMPGLTRDGQLGKWIWEMAEQGSLPLEEIARELDCQFNRFVDLFGRAPTHIDSHHHVHMIPAIFPLVAEFARRKGVALRVDRGEKAWKSVPDLPATTDGFSSAFYGEEISEALFLQVLERSLAQGERSLEVMAHPALIDNTLRKSAYCWPRLSELEVLTSASLKKAIVGRGYRLGNFSDL